MTGETSVNVIHSSDTRTPMRYHARIASRVPRQALSLNGHIETYRGKHILTYDRYTLQLTSII